MMKRVSAILLSLALSASLCLPTLAAGITVDGKTVSDAEAVTMVPLRSVSEALGWTVTWDGSLPGARVETGQVRIDVTLGKDLYQTVSIAASGKGDPFSLGAAPRHAGARHHLCAGGAVPGAAGQPGGHGLHRR